MIFNVLHGQTTQQMLQVTESVEKMRAKERFINNQYDGLREEYRQVKNWLWPNKRTKSGFPTFYAGKIHMIYIKNARIFHRIHLKFA